MQTFSSLSRLLDRIVCAAQLLENRRVYRMHGCLRKKGSGWDYALQREMAQQRSRSLGRGGAIQRSIVGESQGKKQAFQMRQLRS
jgi:hypothetical protein